MLSFIILLNLTLEQFSSHIYSGPNLLKLKLQHKAVTKTTLASQILHLFTQYPVYVHKAYRTRANILCRLFLSLVPHCTFVKVSEIFLNYAGLAKWGMQ